MHVAASIAQGVALVVAVVLVVFLLAFTVPSHSGSVVGDGRRASADSAPQPGPVPCSFGRGLGGTADDVILVKFSPCRLTTVISFTEFSSGGATSNGTPSVGSAVAYSYNLSYLVGGIAEVSPTGQVVEFSNLTNASSISSSQVIGNNGITYTFDLTESVANASGAWGPALFEGGGTPAQGQPTGQADIEFIFDVSTSSASEGVVKFSLDITDWPWLSPSDSLGIEISALPRQGSDFAWNASTQTLSEGGSSGSPSSAEIEFGSEAWISGQQPNNMSIASANARVNASEAIVVVNFTGVAGGYGFLHYDPWVIFKTPASGAITWTLIMVLAVSGGAAVALVLGVALYGIRREAFKVSLCGTESRRASQGIH